MGFEKFLAAVEQEFGASLARLDDAKLGFADTENRWAHVGSHPQKQPGQQYVGLVLPVGRITSDQLRGIAAIADRYGDRYVRTTDEQLIAWGGS